MSVLVGPRSAEVLRALASADGPRTAPQLYEAAGLTPKTSSKTLQRLEARGLIERAGVEPRQPGVGGNIADRWQITEAGRRVLGRVAS